MRRECGQHSGLVAEARILCMEEDVYCGRLCARSTFCCFPNEKVTMTYTETGSQVRRMQNKLDSIFYTKYGREKVSGNYIPVLAYRHIHTRLLLCDCETSMLRNERVFVENDIKSEHSYHEPHIIIATAYSKIHYHTSWCWK